MRRIAIIASLAWLASCAEEGAVSPATLEEPDAQVGDEVYVDDAGEVCAARTSVIACVRPRPGDEDGDGSPTEIDCDDRHIGVFPGASETECNEIDEDCDGEDLCWPDEDGDGVRANADCDDRDPARSPLLEEVFCNGIDDHCGGRGDYCDRDGDGQPGPADCDDEDPDVSSAGVELACDGIDNDCEAGDCCEQDDDADGYTCRQDCDDRNRLAHPGAEAPRGCYMEDRDCDGSVDGLDC